MGVVQIKLSGICAVNDMWIGLGHGLLVACFAQSYMIDDLKWTIHDLEIFVNLNHITLFHCTA